MTYVPATFIDLDALDHVAFFAQVNRAQLEDYEPGGRSYTRSYVLRWALAELLWWSDFEHDHDLELDDRGDGLTFWGGDGRFHTDNFEHWNAVRFVYLGKTWKLWYCNTWQGETQHLHGHMISIHGLKFYFIPDRDAK